MPTIKPVRPAPQIYATPFTKVLRVMLNNQSVIQLTSYVCDPASGQWSLLEDHSAVLPAKKPVTFFGGVAAGHRGAFGAVVDGWTREYPTAQMHVLGTTQDDYPLGFVDFPGGFDPNVSAASAFISTARKLPSRNEIELGVAWGKYNKPRSDVKPLPGYTSVAQINLGLPVYLLTLWLEDGQNGSIVFPAWPADGTRKTIAL